MFPEHHTVTWSQVANPDTSPTCVDARRKRHKHLKSDVLRRLGNADDIIRPPRSFDFETFFQANPRKGGPWKAEIVKPWRPRKVFRGRKPSLPSAAPRHRLSRARESRLERTASALHSRPNRRAAWDCLSYAPHGTGRSLPASHSCSLPAFA